MVDKSGLLPCTSGAGGLRQTALAPAAEGRNRRRAAAGAASANASPPNAGRALDKRSRWVKLPGRESSPFDRHFSGTKMPFTNSPIAMGSVSLT